MLEPSRRGRPVGGRRFSREQILEAALRVLDAEGLNAVTMRRLGRELGADPMVIYSHLPGREGLLDAIVEAILRDAHTGAAEPEPRMSWQKRSEGIARGYRAALLRHPAAAPLLATRPATSPYGLAVIDAWLGTLLDAGFPTHLALDAITCITTYTTGQTLADTAAAAPEGEPTRRERVRALAGADQLRHLAAVLDASNHDQEARFTLGLRALIAGLDQQRGRSPGK